MRTLHPHILPCRNIDFDVVDGLTIDAKLVEQSNQIILWHGYIHHCLLRNWWRKKRHQFIEGDVCVHAIKLLKAKADVIGWDIAVLYPVLEGFELPLHNVVKEPVLVEGQVSVSAALYHDVLCMIERSVDEEAWLGPVIWDHKSIVV